MELQEVTAKVFHDTNLSFIYMMLSSISLTIEEAEKLQTDIWLRVGASVEAEVIGEDHLD